MFNADYSRTWFSVLGLVEFSLLSIFLKLMFSFGVETGKYK